MREGSIDKVLDKALKRKDQVSDIMSKQFKGERNLSPDRLSPMAKIWAVDNLGLQDMDELRQEFGDEAIGYVLYQINKSRSDGRTKWRTKI